MNTARLCAGVAAVLLGLGCGDDGSATGSETSGGSTTTTGDTADTTAATTDMGTSSGATTGEDETDTDTEPELVGACPGTSLRPRPADPAMRGPWAVGASTVQIEGLRAEVWYPAEDPGPRIDPVVYDIRESLPASEQDKISDADNPWQTCDCYRDLPIDGASGPYPVILFIHGTAGFRTQSLPHMVHWASRGFVVIAADHPGLWLADLLGGLCGADTPSQNLQGDLDSVLAAVRGEVGGLEPFIEHLDPERIAASGHSAGGMAVSQAGDRAQVIIPMAARGVNDGPLLESSLILGAMADSVVPFDDQVMGYESTSPRKRLVGIANTGHLAFAQLCSLYNDAGDDLLEIATAAGVCGAAFAGALFQCDSSFLPDPDGWEITNFASSAVLEETLHCEPLAAEPLASIQQRYPAAMDFREAL
ncbi:alpha/beta hydrolase [Paraliomyxa miuraensis]|uniref:alpha/beta hydrolase n=1 Tax=Paraliomyxa miuraensis TaxID=376150 RepID=UPI00225AC464|nr:alpha/beta hydrolase [Paraliomyxa miuraensis]MCX4247307.1 alpha/beta hydrolase [Paraliomyxa miuraensis]